MVRIPVEYQEVEYLESSGTQWINTGVSVRVIANAQTTWRLRFSPVTMDRTRIICGANTDEKQVPLMNDGRIRKDWAVSQRTYFSKSISVDSIYSIEQSNGYFSLEYSDGDIESEEITKTGSLQDMPFGLFAKITNSEGTSVETTTIAPVKIYGFIAVGDSKICELIPCYRKSDSEPGMYDTVTKQFFTNQGTGTFIVGNDVSWEAIDLLALRRMVMLSMASGVWKKITVTAPDSYTNAKQIADWLTTIKPDAKAMFVIRDAYDTPASANGTLLFGNLYDNVPYLYSRMYNGSRAQNTNWTASYSLSMDSGDKYTILYQ